MAALVARGGVRRAQFRWSWALPGGVFVEEARRRGFQVTTDVAIGPDAVPPFWPGAGTSAPA